MKSEVLSVKEKIGYGMGDAASHIIFDNVMLYMMFFYTDIFGIPAGFVGTMFLVARALDAISDPCMGLLADRTRSRWGKFRPWVLFGALPFGIVCVLAYSTPDLSMNGKMIYAAITYTLLTLLYTIVNIPYCALGGVITNDPTQRISLQSWRFVLARCLCSNWGWPSVVPLSAGCWLMADMMRQKKRRTAPQLASLSRYSRLFRRSVTC